MAGDGRVVLVVDDDGPTREMLRDVLEEDGFLVLEASDGVDALSKLRRGARPALILADVHMPKMDGPTLVATLKRQGALRRIPVILLTADAGATKRAGDVVVVLHKPLSRRRLIGAVEECARA